MTRDYIVVGSGADGQAPQKSRLVYTRAAFVFLLGES